jgi:hypothetical protein
MRFTNFIAAPVKFGAIAFPAMANRAPKVRVRDGWPRRHAAMILVAARSALIERNGSPFENENQVNSAA